LRRVASCSRIIGGREEPPRSAVREALDDCLGERHSLAVPAVIRTSLIEGDQRLEQVCVVVEKAGLPSACAAAAVGRRRPVITNRAQATAAST